MQTHPNRHAHTVNWYFPCIYFLFCPKDNAAYFSKAPTPVMYIRNTERVVEVMDTSVASAPLYLVRGKELGVQRYSQARRFTLKGVQLVMSINKMLKLIVKQNDFF